MSNKPVLLSGADIIDPASGRDGAFDILIENGVVKAIDKPGAFKSVDKIIEHKLPKHWIVPGLIDLHVHLREPGFEWKETIQTGSEAAILGGFTSICCMPNTRPVNDSAEIADFIRAQASKVALARVLPIGAISLGSLGKELAPFSELSKAGCVAFSDDGEPVLDAGLMRRALEWVGMMGMTLSCHEEEKTLSCGGCMNESARSNRMGLKGMPKVAEEVMIARDIELARTVGSKVHICHISSGRSLELIRRAKNDGIQITCEVTPHHLCLSEEAVEGYDTNAKMSPPLREEYEVKNLQQGLIDGSIDAVASDHAPHDADSKAVEFGKASFGILGLQTSLPLLLDFVRNKMISRVRAIELLTSGPAKAFGMGYGTLKVGAPADITVINPDREWKFEKDVVRSKSKNSPFLGRVLRGSAELVMVSGRIVVEDGKILGESRA